MFVILPNPPKLRLWQPEPPEVRELKAMLSRLSALKKDIQRERNRLEKSLITVVSKDVVKSIKIMIKSLEKAHDMLERQIDKHIDNHPNLRQAY